MPEEIIFEDKKARTIIDTYLKLGSASKNVKHIPQAPLVYWVVDYYLPDYNIVIQVDGDYWHGNPLMYGKGEGLRPLSKKQRRQRRADASCNTHLRNKGYNVIRLWEHDLKCNLQTCRQLLQNAIRKHCKE